MADGRFVSKKISNSRRVNELSDGAALLYSWMIAHLDCEGRMHGDPRIVKQTVAPLRRWSIRQVEKWLEEMAGLTKNGAGLITRYEVEGEKFIAMLGFEGEQRGLRKDRERPSVIPPPPAQRGRTPPPAKDEKADITDLKLAAIAECYESNIGQLTPMIREELIEICDKYPDGWFEDAVKEAVKQQVRKLSYVTSILERWQTEGKGSGRKQPAKKSTGKDDDAGMRVKR